MLLGNIPFKKTNIKFHNNKNIGMKNIEETITKNTNKMINTFNQLIASYHVYYQNLRNFHWNVEGENFYTLHELFEDRKASCRERV